MTNSKLVIDHTRGLESAEVVNQITSLMEYLYRCGEFNGCILISLKGEIYKKAFGKSNFETNQQFSVSTPTCIASLSKQFKAVGTLMLHEKKTLQLDDLIETYLPEFTGYPQPVTIRHLLTHSSGLPDLDNMGIDHPKLTTQEILQALSRHNVPVRRPGECYEYISTGYELLTAILERTSNMSLLTFFEKNIFAPLGMTSTFFFDGTMNKPSSTALSYNDYGRQDKFDTFSEGDQGIYSSAIDLFKWNAGLFSGSLVSKSFSEISAHRA